MAGGGGTKLTVIAAFLGNLTIAILKLAAGIMTRSASMLAEAAHSFSDTGNQVLLMIGLRQSAKGPDPRHQFGKGKNAYFWPLMVAFLLFAVAGAYSVFEGIERFIDPHELTNVGIAYAVLGVSAIVEGGVLYVAVRQAMQTVRARGYRSLRNFIAHNRDATLLTVLVEDSLALAGLLVAMLGLTLAVVTGNPRWDALGSFTIGLLLMGFALFLARENRDLLLGESMAPPDERLLMECMMQQDEVESVVSLRSMHLSPEEVLLAAEVDFRDGMSSNEVKDAITRIEATLKETVPALKFVFLEPARARPRHRREPGTSAFWRGGRAQ